MISRIATPLAWLLVLASSSAFAQEQKPPPAETFDTRFANAGFSLRQSLSGPTKPATFAYERTGGENFAEAKFALVYQHGFFANNNLFIGQLAAEGDIGGATETRNNNFLRVNGSVGSFSYMGARGI